MGLVSEQMALSQTYLGRLVSSISKYYQSPLALIYFKFS